jgi:hypothetical protein
MIVVVYVDDIIFRGNEGMCKKFSNEIEKEFEISMCVEMNFFLGLQISQLEKVFSFHS